MNVKSFKQITAVTLKCPLVRPSVSRRTIMICNATNSFMKKIFFNFLSIIQIFPVVYSLMTRKTANCYNALFEFIENKLFQMQSKEIMSDFEEGLRSAIKKQWPNVILHGCWFHFCRAIMKKSIKYGMKNFIRQNERTKGIRKALMSIPLLPADKIQEGFDCIKDYAKKHQLFKGFSRLFSYFKSYWLDSQVWFISTLSLCNIKVTVGSNRVLEMP